MVVSSYTKRFICEARLTFDSASPWYQRRQSVNFWQQFLNVPQNCSSPWNDEESDSQLVPTANHAYGNKWKCMDCTLTNICSIHVRIIYEVSKLHKKVALVRALQEWKSITTAPFQDQLTNNMEEEFTLIGGNCHFSVKVPPEEPWDLIKLAPPKKPCQNRSVEQTCDPWQEREHCHPSSTVLNS